jgi:hypothetical protein
MTPQEAARSLNARLRGQPWLTGVGIGQQNGETVLYVYANTSRRVDLPIASNRWEGFPVYVKRMGTPRPA